MGEEIRLIKCHVSLTYNRLYVSYISSYYHGMNKRSLYSNSHSIIKDKFLSSFDDLGVYIFYNIFASLYVRSVDSIKGINVKMSLTKELSAKWEDKERILIITTHVLRSTWTYQNFINKLFVGLQYHVQMRINTIDVQRCFYCPITVLIQ